MNGGRVTDEVMQAQLIDIAKSQAATAAASVEIQRDMKAVLVDIRDATIINSGTLARVEVGITKLDEARIGAVAEIKTDIRALGTRRNGSRWFGYVMMAASTIAAAALTGLAVMRASQGH